MRGPYFQPIPSAHPRQGVRVRGRPAGGRGGRAAVPSPGLTPAGRRLAGSEPGSSPGPPPRPPRRGLPQIRAGRRAGASAANERARRLREPGRLCPPGIGHAVGSGGRGLGAPRAWLGQACCWVTGRRVSLATAAGTAHWLAGKEGGRGHGQAPQTPATARGPRPAGER